MDAEMNLTDTAGQALALMRAAGFEHAQQEGVDLAGQTILTMGYGSGGKDCVRIEEPHECELVKIFGTASLLSPGRAPHSRGCSCRGFRRCSLRPIPLPPADHSARSDRGDRECRAQRGCRG